MSSLSFAELKNKSIRGVVALVGRAFFLQGVSLVAFFFIGIFLSPEAVGTFIVVSSLVRVGTIFSDLGLGAALIQKKEALDEDDLATVFTIQEAIVLFVVAVGFVLEHWVVGFLQLDRGGVFLYRVLLLTLVISSLKVIPSILMERGLAFERQIFPQIVESLVFNLVAVGLAWRGFGVTAYSWAVLLSALVGLPIYYLLAPFKVRLAVSRAKARRFLSYGLLFQGKSFLAVIKDDLLTFFLGGVVGATGIGYWGWAQRWAYGPFRLVVDSVTKVTFPAYSRLQDSRELLGRVVAKSLFAVSLVMFPVVAIMVVVFRQLVILFGQYSKWEPALVSFYFLGAASLVSALSNVLVNALDASGRVKTTLGLMVMWILSTWTVTLVLVTRFGFSGIAAASFLVSLTIVVTVKLVGRVAQFDFVGSVVKPAVAAGAGIFVMVLVLVGLPVNFLTLIAVPVIGGIIYLVVIRLWAGRELEELVSSFRGAYREI